MINIKVGNNLKSIRQQHNYSRRELSELSGLSPGYLEEIENDKKTPTIDTLLKISRVYQITVSNLIGEVNDFLSPDINHLIKNINKLTKKQISKLDDFIQSMLDQD